jgi:hypothetical protein
MEPNLSLKEFDTPILNDHPLYIVFPEVTTAFKLYFVFIQLLPSFHWLPGGDTHRHLKEFHVVYSNMKLDGVQDEVVKMHAILFSLHGLVKGWLYDLAVGFINNWLMIQRFFLEKYSSTSRAAYIREEIYSVRQLNGKYLYDY